MKKENYTDEEGQAIIKRLVPFYVRHIEKSIDWKVVEKDFNNSDYQEEDDGGFTCRSFLGTVFSIMPSGKYWAFWANSNVNHREIIKDTAFSEALELVAQSYGCWTEEGCNDPCDMFVSQFREEGETQRYIYAQTAYSGEDISAVEILWLDSPKYESHDAPVTIGSNETFVYIGGYN